MGIRRWPVPELCTTPDVAYWLAVAPSELDWFADVRGLNADVATPALSPLCLQMASQTTRGLSPARGAEDAAQGPTASNLARYSTASTHTRRGARFRVGTVGADVRAHPRRPQRGPAHGPRRLFSIDWSRARLPAVPECWISRSGRASSVRPLHAQNLSSRTRHDALPQLRRTVRSTRTRHTRAHSPAPPPAPPPAAPRPGRADITCIGQPRLISARRAPRRRCEVGGCHLHALR